MVIDYGWAAPGLPEQFTEQNIELGDKQEWAVRVFESIRICYSNQIVTKTEMAKIVRRYEQRLLKMLAEQ